MNSRMGFELFEKSTAISPPLRHYLATENKSETGRMEMKLSMDWSKFDLAMADPRYLHGAPVFKEEPRMPVQAVLDNLDDGMSPEDIAKAYQIELRLVTSVKHFAESQRFAHSV
jgi:uncharacterized protein (DUF433 family)